MLPVSYDDYFHKGKGYINFYAQSLF